MAQQMVKRTLWRTLRRLMREKPFSAITIEEICQEAGTSRRNFYRYFSDKYELLSCLYYEEYFSKIQIREDWGVWDYHPLLCRQCYEDIDFFKNAFAVEGQNSLRNYARDLLAPLIRHDYRETGLSEETMDFFITNSTNVLFNYMQDWLNSNPCMPPEEFSDHVRDTCSVYAKRLCEITARDKRKR